MPVQNTRRNQRRPGYKLVETTRQQGQQRTQQRNHEKRKDEIMVLSHLHCELDVLIHLSSIAASSSVTLSSSVVGHCSVFQSLVCAVFRPGLVGKTVDSHITNRPGAFSLPYVPAVVLVLVPYLRTYWGMSTFLIALPTYGTYLLYVRRHDEQRTYIVCMPHKKNLFGEGSLQLLHVQICVIYQQLKVKQMVVIVVQLLFCNT